jgi:hypothetical protein
MRCVLSSMDSPKDTYDHPIESNARCHGRLGFGMSLPMVPIDVNCGSLQKSDELSVLKDYLVDSLLE